METLTITLVIDNVPERHIVEILRNYADRIDDSGILETVRDYPSIHSLLSKNVGTITLTEV